MLFFLLYIFLETIITVNISSQIGGFATFVEIVVSALFGLFLLTNFRYTLANNITMLFSKDIDADEFLKLSAYSFVGAILLIVPGFFSDILGVLLQFSSVGAFVAKRIFGLKPHKTNKKQDYKGDFHDEIIDVEVIDGKLSSK